MGRKETEAARGSELEEGLPRDASGGLPRGAHGGEGTGSEQRPQPPLRALDPAGPAVGACARTLGNPGPRLQTVGVCAERHRVLLPAFGTGREFKASGNG